MNYTATADPIKPSMPASAILRVFAAIFNSFAFAAAVLGAQNLIIFYKHYFSDRGFPWDFVSTYFAYTSYWINLASRGYLPTWNPYAQMGFPADFIFQSGMHYLPYWIIPLFKVEYNGNTAVAFQCLHVLFGALGMFLFLRTTLKNTPAALLGAFAFQFFGGFYSNAEHADIVRAFAYAPWLLYAFYLDAGMKISARHLLIPALILLIATGIYPGSLVATAVVIGLYFSAQCVQLFLACQQRKRLAGYALSILGLAILGAGLSFFHIAPALFYRSYVYRYSAQNAEYAYLTYQLIPGMFLNNNVFPTDISQSSSFISLPVLMLAAFTTRKTLKQWWPLLAVAAFSALMAAGPASGLWFLLTKLVPTLGISRFPASEYRVFVAIAMIFLGAQGLLTLLAGEIGWRPVLLRLAVALALVAQMFYNAYQARGLELGWRRIPALNEALLTLALTLGLLALIAFWPRKGQGFALLAVALTIALAALNARQVLPKMNAWQGDDLDAIYAKNDWPLIENGHVMAPVWLMNWPEQRPERLDLPVLDYAWRGYITGKYVIQDRAPYVLNAPYAVAAQPVYFDYIRRAWMPLLFDPQREGQVSGEISVSRIREKVAGFDARVYQSVRQTRYGINTIDYQVDLARPTIMVENEIYFPGWTARLDMDGKPATLEAFATNGIFRSWVLPAGRYRMTAEFVFPHSGLFRAISLLALLDYVVVIAALVYPWKRRARTAPSPAQ